MAASKAFNYLAKCSSVCWHVAAVPTVHQQIGTGLCKPSKGRVFQIDCDMFSVLSQFRPSLPLSLLIYFFIFNCSALFVLIPPLQISHCLVFLPLRRVFSLFFSKLNVSLSFTWCPTIMPLFGSSILSKIASVLKENFICQCFLSDHLLCDAYALLSL